MKFTADQIAKILNGKVDGDGSVNVSDFSKIESASDGTITFLANPKYEGYIYNTNASIALVNSDFIPSKPLPKSLTLIKVEDAYQSLAQLMRMYDQASQKKEGVESPVFVHPTAKIGKSVYIGAFCYVDEDVVIEDHVKLHAHTHIGKGSRIGTNSSIFSGVKIYHNIQVGAHCIIHAGAVIGSDGFGFAPNKENEYQKVPQIGNVIIHDHVEIGANTTVDRATIGSTILKKGVKLDNLVQIAHNVEIGENSVVAAQTGIAGSTKIGNDVMIGGQVGIVGHITIAKGTKIAAQSGVGHSISEENSIIQGSPAFPIGEYKRSYVLFKNLPKIRKQIIDLSAKINKQEKNV